MLRKLGALLLALCVTASVHCAAYDGRRTDETLREHIRTLCGEYGVPETLVLAVIEKESSWNADAVNFAWLRKELDIEDPKEAFQNVQAGIYMLSLYLEKYIDYQMALMCYNCGENGARRLWQKGYYTSAYSRWVVARMDELEWEALQEARDVRYLQNRALSADEELPIEDEPW